MRAPRVTLGIATYERDTYLAEAIASCLNQDFDDFEVLVVLDGGRNPRVEEIVAGFDDLRLRVVRHDVNKGIAEAYNTIVRDGRGELVGILGDDDVSEPDRLARSVAVFERHPETGVVHGDATIIDEHGRPHGVWKSADLPPAELLDYILRRHNPLIDPTRLVHRRLYEAVGGYDARYHTSQDFHFWLRAAPHFRFRHCAGAPLIKLRRHSDNASGGDALAREVREVSDALREAFDRTPLERLAPGVEWDLLPRAQAERRAWETLADALGARQLPLPELAAELRARARAARPAPASAGAPKRRRIVMTSFGFNDSGGGTAVPRMAAKELARRGWDVTVFHAAVPLLPDAPPYTVRAWEEDGVRLVGVFNRAHGLFDFGHPLREVDDPPITAAFADLLDRVRPDVVHMHNLHNLGGALIDDCAARGIATFFSPHNHWLLCPRAYLRQGDGSICAGPGRGADCASCVGGGGPDAYERRFAELRDRLTRGVHTVLAMSHSVRRALVASGYDADQIDIVPQSVPAVARLWEQLGRDRAPGRADDARLTVGFFGSLYGHKGPQMLVEAAQRVSRPIRVVLHGEGAMRFGAEIEALDHRGLVEVAGGYAAADLPRLLADVDVAVLPSTVYETQGLVALECLAGRVPVVVPRLGALREAVRDGVDGLTFAAADSASLAAVLDRLAGEQPGLLERLQSGIAAPRTFSDYVDDLEAYYAGERPGRARVRLDDGAPAVRWQGEHARHDSLATINREVVGRLEGLHVQRVDARGRAIDAPLPHLADVEVRHAWPPDFRPAPAGRLALIQPWEFGSVPRAWIEPLRREVDELWVPSEYVRAMYLDGGLDPDRVHVVPNGVDLERFRPDGARYDLGGRAGLRLLFVGGAIWRKGIDLLLGAYREAFAGRDDVTLVVKDFGGDGVYRGADRSALRSAAERADGPRVVHLDADLDGDDLASLYRACDVLVHPYRGEGFAMPVLEAMACGLPVVLTDGGPTDEFCPPDASWRVVSRRLPMPGMAVDGVETVGTPWVLQPDLSHLVETLRAVEACGPAERAARGAAGRRAAEKLSWTAVSERYAERVRALAARPRVPGRHVAAACDLEGDASVRVLATPAWRGVDRLGELLAAWAAAAPAGTDACLHLLADPDVDGDAPALEAHVLAAAAAAGLDLDACADVDLRLERASPGRDEALHAATDVYVPLHPACAGHERLARAARSTVLAPDAAILRARLVAAGTATPTA